MPVRSLFSGTQDLSPPRSFQSLLAGGQGRALASSQRVTSSWLPLWTSRRPTQLTSCFLWARPLQPWRWWSIRLPLRFQKHSDGATVIRIMADASPWAERRAAAEARSRGAGDAQAAATLAESPQVPDIVTRLHASQVTFSGHSGLEPS